MANYRDYIKALDLDDGDPEGSGDITLSLSVSGFGTDGNYGSLSLPLFTIDADGNNVSYGDVSLPILQVDGHANNYAQLTLPSFSLSATRGHCGIGDCQLVFKVIGDGNDAPPLGGDVELPSLTLLANGGPRMKIYELCNNENYGL